MIYQLCNPTAKQLILFMEIIQPHLPESVLFSAKRQSVVTLHD